MWVLHLPDAGLNNNTTTTLTKTTNKGKSIVNDKQLVLCTTSNDTLWVLYLPGADLNNNNNNNETIH
jgi:hypothetical protein